METENAAAGELSPAPVVGLPNLFEAGAEDYSPETAAREYTEKLNKPAESAEPPATADKESKAEEAEDAAPPEAEATGETQEGDPAEEPPLELPRSWTKEQAEHWKALPRATQEFLLEQASKSSAEVRRSQNEAAEARKAVEAERKALETSRQQYEQALPALLQTLQEQQAGEFSDIKTMADVTKLATEDPQRYLRWDAQQKMIAAVTQEHSAVRDRQQKEFEAKWSEYASKQDALLLEHVPELSDKSKASKIADGSISLLKDIGFTDEEIANAWNGRASISLRDNRIQRLIIDGFRYREAKSAPPKAVPKQAPAVQKPGVAAPKAVAAVNVQNLRSKLSDTGSVEDAFALYTAKQRRRAS